MRRLPVYLVLVLFLISLMLMTFPSENIQAEATDTVLSSNTTIQPKLEGPVLTSAIVSSDDGLECMLIDFEGMGDNVPIGTVPGTPKIPNAVFGSSWLSLVDFDAGGNGNFANEPSPSTIAYYLDQNDISITFDAAVQVVEFYYTAAADSIPVTVTALNADGALVRKCVGNTVGTSFDGAACSGDPSGSYCCWDKISLASTSNNIRRISIAGTVSNHFGIDNLRVCVGACAPPEGEDPTEMRVPIADSCCWHDSDNCIERRNFPLEGTSEWDDCLLGRIEADSGEKLEVWCIAGPDPCGEGPGHYEMRYFYPTGEHYMVGACWFPWGVNSAYLFHSGDSDDPGDKPDCFIRTTWLNLDGGDYDEDGMVDWYFFTFDVVNNSLTKTAYESSDGPYGPEPDIVTGVDPQLGPETEAWFRERIAEYEQTVTPEAGPMGPYPYARCDLNGDGTCNDSDLQIFEGAFESCIGDVNFNSLADFNGDGCVTLEDQNLLFPPEIKVAVDIKPTSCPNPLNVKSKGVLPVAILGTEEFDVMTVDPASILLNLGLHVSPLRWAYEDVATPYEMDCGGCHELGPDGYLDLVLKFDTPELVAQDLLRHEDGAEVVLQITGNLKEEFSGSPIIGEDTIVVINKMK